MAITYKIEDEMQTGLRRKSVFAIVRNNTPVVAYRRAEVIMPLETDADTHIGTLRLSDLWASGEDSVEATYVAIDERPLAAPVYRPILSKIFTALAGAADLDMIRGQIIAYLQQSPEVYADFVAALKKLGVDATTPEGKREQLLWVVVLALAGLVNGR
mgnify:CR=1 FL=1